ncbi:hypothetical protein ACFVH0_24755 [Streptomyces sp. NPDC127117]|uniref:hypothetical protein n=1 Tax=Streptomyces sp. NPDC127117 TaxID=3345368 RepID=UPI00363D6AC1
MAESFITAPVTAGPSDRSRDMSHTDAGQVVADLTRATTVHAVMSCAPPPANG